MRSTILLASALALAVAGCAPSAATSVPPPPTSNTLYNSPPMGLVGLLLVNPAIGPPRAAGMKGQIVGYVVSHPALPSTLWVRKSRDGTPLPVLAFKMSIVIVEAVGTDAGLEKIRGNGSLDVYYRANGFTDALLHYAGTIEESQKIESDRIEFDGHLNTDTNRFYLRLQEITIATWSFRFQGRQRRMPASRIASDILVGENSEGFFGEAFSSNNAMGRLSSEEKLIAIVGPPQRVVHY